MVELFSDDEWSDAATSLKVFNITMTVFVCLMVAVTVFFWIKTIIDRNKPKPEKVELDIKSKRKVLVELLLFLAEVLILLFNAILPLHFKYSIIMFLAFIFVIFLIFVIRMFIWKKYNEIGGSSNTKIDNNKNDQQTKD